MSAALKAEHSFKDLDSLLPEARRLQLRFSGSAKLKPGVKGRIKRRGKKRGRGRRGEEDNDEEEEEESDALHWSRSFTAENQKSWI